MKENIENENGLEDLDEDKKYDEPRKRLRSIESILVGGNEEEEEEEEDFKFESLNSKLLSDSQIRSYSSSSFVIDTKNNDLILAKYLYIGKDFIFMCMLLMSSSLNFSWLYFPFIFLSIICYFLLFKNSRNVKKVKLIIEIIALTT